MRKSIKLLKKIMQIQKWEYDHFLDPNFNAYACPIKLYGYNFFPSYYPLPKFKKKFKKKRGKREKGIHIGVIRCKNGYNFELIK